MAEDSDGPSLRNAADPSQNHAFSLFACDAVGHQLPLIRYILASVSLSQTAVPSRRSHALERRVDRPFGFWLRKLVKTLELETFCPDS
jgi:hypothetical protein